MTSNPALALCDARTARPACIPSHGRRAISAAVLVGLVVAFARPSAGEPGSPSPTAAGAALIAETGRRNDALVKEGFNLTDGFTVDAAHPVRLELMLPPSDDDELEIALWFEAVRGAFAVRFEAPAGEVVASWIARRGEQRLTRVLPPGRYVVEVDARDGATGSGLVGVKGPVIGRCEIDPARVSEHAADPAHGFRWPYLLAAPASQAAGGPALPGGNTLLVLPLSTGFTSSELELLRATARCQLSSVLALADRLGTPVLVPVFPRPPAPPPENNLYLHALSRESLQVRDAALARVDLQLIAMIDDARAALGRTGRKIQPRVLIAGFSAAGMFANRFAILHPDRTLAASIGSPGGWPIAPVADDRGRPLPYPVGVADVELLTGRRLDRDGLRRVRFLFQLGDADTNDSVPARDSFSPAGEAQVMQLFGKTPVARWPAAQRLYEAARLRARFTLYPGVGHMVTPEMRADTEAVFRAALGDLR